MNQTSRNEVMQLTTSSNGLQPIVPYHLQIHVGFDNLFVNGRGFFYPRAFRRWVQLFKIVQDSVLIRVTRKTNIWLHVYQRFPSVGDHSHATPTSEHAWATPRHAVIGGC